MRLVFSALAIMMCGRLMCGRQVIENDENFLLGVIADADNDTKRTPT